LNNHNPNSKSNFLPLQLACGVIARKCLVIGKFPPTQCGQAGQVTHNPVSQATPKEPLVRHTGSVSRFRAARSHAGPWPGPRGTLQLVRKDYRLVREKPPIEWTENPIQPSYIEGEQENEDDDHYGCRANLFPGRSADQLHFLFYVSQKADDLGEQVGFLFCRLSRHLFCIMFRQETRFLPGLPQFVCGRDGQAKLRCGLPNVSRGMKQVGRGWEERGQRVWAGGTRLPSGSSHRCKRSGRGEERIPADPG
jgi:hypothetical protein